jgi:hypothetical protein
MNVTRKVNMDVKKFKVGDQISIKINGFGKFTATVQTVGNKQALFFLDRCVCVCPMNANDTNKGGFYASALYSWMKDNLLLSFPTEIRNSLVPIGEYAGNPVLIRIPTYAEMFGQDIGDHYEEDGHCQLPLMKEIKNRIGTILNDGYEVTRWSWLYNTKKDSAKDFACVKNYGEVDWSVASNLNGVRPVFAIRMN